MTADPPRIGWDNPNPMSGKRSGWRHPAQQSDAGRWMPCPHCWGNKQFFVRKQDGLIPVACPTCLAIGFVYREDPS